MQPPTSTTFKKLFTTHLAPKLKAMGWKGSGYHYRKHTDNHYIYLLSVEVDPYGGACWVEIGVHLDFLKDISGKKYNLQKMVCYQSDIRRRLRMKKHASNAENTEWKLLETEEQNTKVLDDIWDAFLMDGQDFFQQFSEFPGPFQYIELADFDQRDEYDQIKGIPFPPDIRTAWYLAQVWTYLGNPEKVCMFVDFALSLIGEKDGEGSMLVQDLEG